MKLKSEKKKLLQRLNVDIIYTFKVKLGSYRLHPQREYLGLFYSVA